MYFYSTINAYFHFSHEWWVILIKSMMEHTIHVGGDYIFMVLREYLIIFFSPTLAPMIEFVIFERIFWILHVVCCGGQLIPCVQTALEEAGPNIQSYMYRLYKKGLGPISSPRIREYPRTTSKGRDKSYTPRRSKECL